MEVALPEAQLPHIGSPLAYLFAKQAYLFREAFRKPSVGIGIYIIR